MKKLPSVFLSVAAAFGLSRFFFPSVIQAVCPLCTIAVGAGLGFSRWLGIDDMVTGLWIGALIISSSLWTVSFAQKRNWEMLSKTPLVIFLFYLLVIPPLFWSKIIGHPANTLWGIDKVLLGTTFGSLAFSLAVYFEQWLRRQHDGKIFFYYQKVLVPVTALTLLSLLFYLITLPA